jgi:hypothetical protein
MQKRNKELKNMRATELKQWCLSHKLRTSGSKSILIERIMDYECSQNLDETNNEVRISFINHLVQPCKNFTTSQPKHDG